MFPVSDAQAFAHFLAGLEIGNALLNGATEAPVLGLRPVRPSRDRVEKAPKPRSSTRPPSARRAVMVSKKTVTIKSSSRADKPGLASDRNATSSERTGGLPLIFSLGETPSL